jgi:hypothetical protein
MHTGHHQEPTEPTAAWREAGVTSEEWEGLHSLLELVRREHLRTELSPERREQIRERLMQSLDKLERRRRRVRAFLVGACALLAAALAAKLVARAHA